MPSWDYDGWLSGLRGASDDAKICDGCTPRLYVALQELINDPTLDFVTHPESVEFSVNNVAMLQNDPRDPTGDLVFHEFEMPRSADVVDDLKSMDPRVSLSVRVNNMLLDPNNNFVLVAAPYNNLYVRMAFSKKDAMSANCRLGVTYSVFAFQEQRRVKLVGGHVFSGPVLYVNGMMEVKNSGGGQQSVLDERMND